MRLLTWDRPLPDLSRSTIKRQPELITAGIAGIMAAQNSVALPQIAQARVKELLEDEEKTLKADNGVDVCLRPEMSSKQSSSRRSRKRYRSPLLGYWSFEYSETDGPKTSCKLSPVGICSVVASLSILR
jgi:hypothetical protein